MRGSDTGTAEVSVEDATKPIDRVVAEVPRAVEVLLGAGLVTVLAGLTVPQSVLFTVPVLIMIGFWVASVGWRINRMLPLGYIILNVFSPMGRYAATVMGLGLSPLFLVMIGSAFAASIEVDGDDEVAAFLRFLLVVFGVFFIPGSLMVRSKALRHLDRTPMEASGQKLILGGGSVLAATVVVSAAAFALFAFDGDDFSTVSNDRERVEEQVIAEVNAAHALWESDKPFEAVQRYKAILRASDLYFVEDELPIMFRRVIEHEVEYGDPAVARDWCLRAYEYEFWEFNPMRSMTFSSEKASRIWQEVVAAGEGSRSPSTENGEGVQGAFERGRQSIEDAYQDGYNE